MIPMKEKRSCLVFLLAHTRIRFRSSPLFDPPPGPPSSSAGLSRSVQICTLVLFSLLFLPEITVGCSPRVRTRLGGIGSTWRLAWGSGWGSNAQWGSRQSDSRACWKPYTPTAPQPQPQSQPQPPQSQSQPQPPQSQSATATVTATATTATVTATTVTVSHSHSHSQPQPYSQPEQRESQRTKTRPKKK